MVYIKCRLLLAKLYICVGDGDGIASWREKNPLSHLVFHSTLYYTFNIVKFTKYYCCFLSYCFSAGHLGSILMETKSKNNYRKLFLLIDNIRGFVLPV